MLWIEWRSVFTDWRKLFIKKVLSFHRSQLETGKSYWLKGCFKIHNSDLDSSSINMGDFFNLVQKCNDKIKFSQLLQRWFSLLGSAFHKFKYRWSYNSWWAATILSQQMMCFEWSSICAFNLTNEMRIDIIINKIYYSLVD